MTDKYDVLGPEGQVLTRLNARLAIKQLVSDDQLEALKMSHQMRWMLFEAAKKSLDEPLKLKMLAAMFDSLEDEQQKLWNFGADPNFHRFFDFPGCACPKMDNAERIGTPYKIYADDCPIHGHLVEKQKANERYGRLGRIMLDDGDLPEMSAEEKRQRYILEHGV